MKSARLAQGDNSFRPPASFVTIGPEGSLPPKHGKSDHSLGVIIGWTDPGLHQKDPKRIHLPIQSASKNSSLVFLFVIQGYQTNEARIKDVPLTPSWRCMRHVAESLKLSRRPFAEFGKLRIGSFGKPFGVTD